MAGPFRGNMMQPPSVNDLGKYQVNRADAPEIISQAIYDTVSYAAAGASQLQFFAIPVGQGGKTYADTNMSIAGSLPSPLNMLVTDIQVGIYPGILPQYGAIADGATTAQFVNDVYRLGGYGGFLEFDIGSKNYLRDAPLCKFPVDHGFGGLAAMSTNLTTGANTYSLIDYFRFAGATYNITPVLLIPTQNFAVTLNFPGTPPVLPSGQAARVEVTLNGWRYRLAQ